MNTIVLILILSTTHGVTAESVTEKIPIYAHEEDEVILQLPEHLLNQTEYIWKKGKEHIATSSGNGYLNISEYLELQHRDMLRISPEGSLIIHADFWENRDEYSVHIMMNNISHSTHFHVKVLSVTAESVTEKIPIYAHEEDEVILQLPEHLLNQTEYIWKKGKEHIATSSGNGYLNISEYLELQHRDMLRISPEGSLIIHADFWENRDEYSVHIMMNDTILSIHFHVKVLNHKYINDITGLTIVSARVGETISLPLEFDILKQSEIKEIDWLTEGWSYFAITKIGGEISILKDIYHGSLSSSSDGSLIFTKVSLKDHGVYRACIFSNKGKILEQMYHLYISDIKMYTFGEYIIMMIMVSSGILICIFFGIIYQHIRCKTTKHARSPPPEENVEMGYSEEMGEMEEIGEMVEIEDMEEKEPKRRQYNQDEP